MTFSVTMPALGESVTEGTVTRWLKNEGDHVSVDEPLLEVSTDKVDTEIPSPVSGTLSRIVVAIDSTVAVGAELAVIEDGAAAPVAPRVETPDIPAVVEVPEVPMPAPVAPPAPVVAAPVAEVPAPVAPVAAQTGGVVVTMPALGESVTEGTVTRWLKNVGDTINVDEPLLEVSTDKVDTEIPSPATGTILAIDVPVDSTVAVGARLALIGAVGVQATEQKAEALVPAPVAPVVQNLPVNPPVITPAPVAPAPVVAAPVVTPVSAATHLDDSYVTPIVRQFAKERGVDLSIVTGSGIGGRIRKEDILAAIKPSTPAPVITSAPAPSVPSRSSAPVVASALRGTTVTMSRLRKVIAARMVESLHISAQLTTVVEVDVTKIARLRDKAKAAFAEREGTNLTFLPFFGVAVCEALKQHPVLNSSIDGDQSVTLVI